MSDRRKAERTRREPVFGTETDSSALDLSLTRADRAGGSIDSEEREVSSRRKDDRPVRGGSKVRTKPQRSRRQRRRRSILGRLFYTCLVLGVWCVIGLAALIAYHVQQLPPIDQLAVPKRPPNIAILASDGTMLANRGETGGRTMSLKELPPYVPNAFIAIEDRRFYSHLGIDPVGIARAMVRNLSSRGVAQGGSTLTQQLAKNLFLTQERTASRKIQEAILALWLEHRYSKKEILELYLNRVYFGAGAYGVEAAAQRYFAKSARDLTLSEAAVLAGLVQAPSRLAPNRNPKGAQARAEQVLANMQEQGLVTPQQYKAALAAPARTVRHAQSGSANYAADLVMDVLDDFVGTIESDITVTTTIEPKLQNAAERALVDELNQKGSKLGVSQGALVAMRPDGAVRALIGGKSYADSQFNRATVARRQPGSSFKPFVYLAAIEHGLTPESVREDGPLNLRGWNPENYGRRYAGPVTLRQALAHSINTVAVRLGLEVGAKTVVQTAQRLGITSPLHANPSIALGTSEVTPIELVGAYAAFANGGAGVIPYIIATVKHGDGKVIYRRPDRGLGRVIEPAAVGAMNSMLQGVVTSGSGRRAAIPGWEVAGKTGTSQDFRDAWFVGYTGSLVAGVWLGNDDNSSTKKVTGGSLPAEIWDKFMKVALAGSRPVPLPYADQYRAPPPSQNPQDLPDEDLPAGTASLPPGGERSRDSGWVPPSRDDRSFLERLFGG